jgi:hypothetical protein
VNVVLKPVPGVRRRLLGSSLVLVVGVALVNDPLWYWQVAGMTCLFCFPPLLFDAICRFVQVSAIRREHWRSDDRTQQFFEHLLSSGQIDRREYDYMMIVLHREVGSSERPGEKPGSSPV